MTPERKTELRARYTAENRFTNPLGSESSYGIDAASECVGAVLELLDALDAAEVGRIVDSDGAHFRAMGFAQRAELAERAAVITWLRGKRLPPPLDGTWETAREVGDGLEATYAHRFADAIERGDHRRTP